MLLGVIREAGELDSGASPVTAAPETTRPSFVGSGGAGKGCYEFSHYSDLMITRRESIYLK